MLSLLKLESTLLARWEFQRTLAQEEWPDKVRSNVSKGTLFWNSPRRVSSGRRCSRWKQFKDTNATFDQQVVEITGVCSDGPSVVLVVHDADLDEDVK